MQREVDILSTGADALEFSRYYSSSGFYTARQIERPAEILGDHWRHSWQSSVTVESAASAGEQTYAYVMFPNGDYRHFRWDGSAWISRTDKSDSLQEIVSGSVRTGWTYTDEQNTIYQYDADGVWQSAGRDGQSTVLSYSDSSTPPSIAPWPGLLISVTNSQGRSLHFNYDQDGYLVRAVAPNGNAFDFRYLMRDVAGLPMRNDGLLLQADRPDGSSREYLYDESPLSPGIDHFGLLTGILDENGDRFATFKYDVQGRAVEEWHGDGDADKLTLTYNGDYTTQTSTTRITDGLGSIKIRLFRQVNGILKDAGTKRCPDASCLVPIAQSSQTYDSDGNVDTSTDYKGVVTAYVHDARGREIERIEASNDASPVAASAKRTIQTDWHATLNVPIERRTYNASAVLEAVSRWAYNSHAQETARCEIDPDDAAAMAYTCSATTAPPVDAKVQRWVTNYCDQADVTGLMCPRIGLVKSTNGPRSSGDPGMNGLDDITTYTYYMVDDTTCASGGVCPHRRGDLWKVTNALGQMTEYVTYDKAGRVNRAKDANGTITDFYYHMRGWLKERIVRAKADGTPLPLADASLYIEYDAVGNVIKVVQPDASWLEYTYDGAHRLEKIADNLGNSIDYCPGGPGSADCLDAAGNHVIEQIKDPSNNVKRQLRRTYNQLSQLTEVLNATSQTVETSADLSATGVADGYDHSGNRVFKEDGLGTRTHQNYDPLNRLKTTIQDVGGTDPSTANATTQYAYDTRDNLRQVTDPDGLSTVYDYDGLNRLTSLHSPDTGDATYAYDAASNRLSQTDARGVTSTYTYDPLNRMTRVAYLDADLDIRYVYDQAHGANGCSGSFPAGRLTTMGDSWGETRYCYDRRGNVTKKIYHEKGKTAQVTQYSYTQADRLASITYPSGGVVTYTRDALGRVQGVTWQSTVLAPPTTLIASTTYAPFGPLTSIAFGNGRTQTRAYDQDYAIDAISGTPAGALTLDFELDVMGNVVEASDNMSPVTPNLVYGYDSMHRLTSVETSAGPPSSPMETYTYNRTGDRMSASLSGNPTEAYGYAPSTHRLASVGAAPRTYDENGNTLTGLPSGYTLTYDDHNRLHRAVKPPTDSATYLYNGKGERMQKAVSNGIVGTVTAFAYDEGGRLLGEYDDAGNVLAEYVYLDRILVAVIRDAALHYVEADHLGTPRQVIDPATNLVKWKWNLMGNAFGANHPDDDADGDGTTFLLSMRFPGQYFDTETGLNYNHFRDYEPGTGRYIESDPIGLLGGMSTYAYVRSSPLRKVDYSGLWSTADLFLADWYLNGTGLFLDISAWCSDYLADPSVQLVAGSLKIRARRKAQELIGLTGEVDWWYENRNALHVSTIHSFGKGTYHIGQVSCRFTGDGCCVTGECKTNFKATDLYTDPIDFHEYGGLPLWMANPLGVPFWFGLSCEGSSFSIRECKKS